jgi:hypothetical protein
VRISDPEVADYTLTRVEASLESVDVALVEALKGNAHALQIVQETARNSSIAPPPPSWTTQQKEDFGFCREAVQEASTHGKALTDALAQAGAPPITASVLFDAQMQANAVVSTLDACQSTLKNIGAFPLLGATQQVIEVGKQLLEVVEEAIDSLGSSARYELRGSGSTRTRKPIGLDNPILWQDAPETTALAAAVASPLMATLAGYSTAKSLRLRVWWALERQRSPWPQILQRPSRKRSAWPPGTSSITGPPSRRTGIPSVT